MRRDARALGGLMLQMGRTVRWQADLIAANGSTPFYVACVPLSCGLLLKASVSELLPPPLCLKWHAHGDVQAARFSTL